MSKTLFTVVLVVFIAFMGSVDFVEAQSGSQYYSKGLNSGYQPSNYLSAYPGQLDNAGFTGSDTWHQGIVSHILWPY